MTRWIYRFRFVALAVLLFPWSSRINGQSILRITQLKWGRVKVTDIYAHTPLKYKTHSAGYRKGELLAMHDSLIFFMSGDTVKIGELKGIRIPDYRYSFRPLQNKLISSGVILVLLSVVNQAGASGGLSYSQPLFIVGGSLVAAGAIAGLLRNKHIRVNRRTSIQILHYDFGHLVPVGSGTKKEN